MNANELADALVNTDYTPLKAECATMLRQQQAEIEDTKRKWLEAIDGLLEMKQRNEQLQVEIEALKAFVKPIVAHGDDCFVDWDGCELQDLAVKAGLLIEVEKTQFCNLGKEEFVGCPCREYHWGEESWTCLETAKFLIDEAQEK